MKATLKALLVVAFTAHLIAGSAAANTAELRRLVELGCPERGIPFFPGPPDRETAYPDPMAGTIVARQYGGHVVAATRQGRNLAVEAVLIGRRDPPHELKSLFALSRQAIIQRYGPGLALLLRDRALRRTNVLFFVMRGVLFEIEFAGSGREPLLAMRFLGGTPARAVIGTARPLAPNLQAGLASKPMPTDPRRDL